MGRKYSNRRSARPPLASAVATYNRQPPVPEYVSLDLETTGLDPSRDRVIEVGAVPFTPDVPLATLERLVDPERPLPDAVARLTGITQSDLRGAASAESAL